MQKINQKFIYKLIVVICVTLQFGHSMESPNRPTDNHLLMYLEDVVNGLERQSPRSKDSFAKNCDISTESAKLETARELFQGAYARQEIALNIVFEDYHKLQNSADEPVILVIGPGYYSFEVRVLRDMNKKIGLVVDGWEWTFAKSIGNIENEELYSGFVQDVPSTWYGKFDVAIWNWFVESEFENTLPIVSRLLKPMGCYYATNSTCGLSSIQKSEKIQEINDEMPIEKEMHFDCDVSGVVGTLRFRKKQ
jgi:hypothetical protein